MSELEQAPRQIHLPGAFCWADLGTPDPEGAKAFYSGLFGWSVHDSPMGDGTFYSMLRRGERDVAALYGQAQDGAPPAWLPYVAVESADRGATEAAARGATVLMEPFDVFTSGRMALIRDPAGATVALWEGRDHPGAGAMNEAGALCWFELMSGDPGAAREFFVGLLGWGSEEMPMGERVYTVFKRGEQSVAGMMGLPEEAGDAPSHWLAYFAVDDSDATAASARDLGGTVLVPPTDIPGVGRFAVLRDPQGAMFGVLGPEGVKG